MFDIDLLPCKLIRMFLLLLLLLLLLLSVLYIITNVNVALLLCSAYVQMYQDYEIKIIITSVAQWVEYSISDSKVPCSTLHMGTQFFVFLAKTLYLHLPSHRSTMATWLDSDCISMYDCQFLGELGMHRILLLLLAHVTRYNSYIS